jgi:hypothetical protein
MNSEECQNEIQLNKKVNEAKNNYRKYGPLGYDILTSNIDATVSYEHAASTFRVKQGSIRS